MFYFSIALAFVTGGMGYALLYAVEKKNKHILSFFYPNTHIKPKQVSLLTALSLFYFGASSLFLFFNTLT